MIYLDSRSIIGLFPAPSNRAIVLFAGENSQLQTLDREQPVLSLASGVAKRRTPTYIRHGITTRFAALGIAPGTVIGKCRKPHWATDFLKILKQVDRQVPEGRQFTPISVSWINQIEHCFAEMTRKQMQCCVNHSMVA